MRWQPGCRCMRRLEGREGSTLWRRKKRTKPLARRWSMVNLSEIRMRNREVSRFVARDFILQTLEKEWPEEFRASSTFWGDPWKSSHIIMIPKPGKDPSSPNSYRLISLINTLGKILKTPQLSPQQLSLSPQSYSRLPAWLSKGPLPTRTSSPTHNRRRSVTKQTPLPFCYLPRPRKSIR